MVAEPGVPGVMFVTVCTSVSTRFGPFQIRRCPSVNSMVKEVEAVVSNFKTRALTVLLRVVP